MDVGGIVGKLESNSDKLGMLAGVATVEMAHGGGNIFAGISRTFTGLMQNPHVPNIQGLFGSLMAEDTIEGKNIRTAIFALIGGYFIKEVGLHPMLTRLGNLFEKLGVGMAEGTLAITALNFAGAFE
jgi:hypothetical protein